MRALALAFAFAAVFLAARPSRAQDTRQAGQHFQRAVALYGEADYRAALVEFERAYALAPNPAVLYNIGETRYQLQDYAGALVSFERFLSEAPPGDAHRPEVEGDVEVLRARVGHVMVTTTPAGADLTVDDQPVGKTPLDRPLRVSIGHRKVVAAMPGRPAVTRYVDVAADDSVAVALVFADSAAPPAPAASPAIGAAQPAEAAPSRGGATLRVLGWTTAGVSAAAAVCFGLLAVRESHDLEAARGAFPASPQALAHEGSLTTTYSMLADGFTAGAVVLGGATLLSTIFAGPSRSRAPRTLGATQILLGPASARLLVTF